MSVGNSTQPTVNELSASNDEARASTRKLAIRGSMWTLGGFGVGQVFRLISNVVVSALLTKHEYGVMALVTVFMSGLQMFSDIGIGPSLIQNPRGEEPIFRDTAWTIGIVRGFGLWLAACVLAWPAAWYYNEPALRSVLPIVGLSAVINAFSSTALILLNRRIDMGRLTLLDFAAQILSLTVMCVWAWKSPTVWALVAGALSSCFFRTLYSFILIRGHRDSIRWDKESAHELIKFGRWVFVSTLITFLATQSDRLMLGKLVSTDMLGVYAIALALMVMAKDIVLRLASMVQFPALARHINDGPGTLDRTLHRSREPMLVLTLASTLAIGLGANTFFSTLYDAQYQDASWIALWLAPSVWFSLLQGTSDRALLALGESRALAMSNLARAIGTIACCLGGYFLARYLFPDKPGYDVIAFLIGLTIGTAAGHVYVAIRLLQRGVSIIRADVLYTLLFLVLLILPALIARKLAGQHWLNFHFRGHDRSVDLAWLGVAIAVMVPTGLWAMRRMHKVVFPK